jgi:tetratricopeptide (TPR) repeat protein
MQLLGETYCALGQWADAKEVYTWLMGAVYADELGAMTLWGWRPLLSLGGPSVSALLEAPRLEPPARRLERQHIWSNYSVPRKDRARVRGRLMATAAATGEGGLAQKLELEAVNLARVYDHGVLLDLAEQYAAVGLAGDVERLVHRSRAEHPQTAGRGFEILADMYRHLGDETKHRATQEEHDAWLSLEIDRSPYDVELRLKRARTSVVERWDLARAREDLLRAAELRPLDHRPLTLMGWVSLRGGEVGEAQRLLEEADRLAAGHGVEADAEILYGLGVIHLRQGRVDEGKALQRRALAIDPVVARYE